MHDEAVTYGDRMVNSTVRGVCPEYGEMRSEVPSVGRWLNASDEVERRHVVFLGNVLKNKLFSGRDAVGDEPSFGPDLHAASPGLSKSRLRQGSLRITPYPYRGVRLHTPLDPDQEPAGEESPTTAEAFAEPPF